MKVKQRIMILFCFSIALSFQCMSQNKDGQYLTEKKDFKTKLVKKSRAPQEPPNLVTTKNVLKIEYTSNNRKLKGLVMKKNIDLKKRKPILVFLHGGFALGEQDLLDCEVFTKQGYIVFAPSYRGENGNGGFFELFFGEVEDAKASIKWIAKQPYADSTKIYVFGHSIGGGISSLLSLEKDVPIAKSGGSGGLYEQDFYGWEDIIPYDTKNPAEGKMRVLVENINSMQINHYAFVGTKDEALYNRKSEFDTKSKNSKLKIFYIEGDHFTSLEPSMKKFIELINEKNN
jgi:hypothetical protein